MTAPSIKEALEDLQHFSETQLDRNPKMQKVVATVVAALATLPPPAGEKREAIAQLAQEFWQGKSGRSWEECCKKLPPQADWFRSLADLILASGLVQDEAGWQPIETAPKDGRYIVVGRFRDDELKWVTRSRWMSAEEACEEEDGASADDYDAGWTDGKGEHDYCYPTHWMPLPAPPIRSARDGGAS